MLFHDNKFSGFAIGVHLDMGYIKCFLVDFPILVERDLPERSDKRTAPERLVQLCPHDRKLQLGYLFLCCCLYPAQSFGKQLHCSESLGRKLGWIFFVRGAVIGNKGLVDGIIGFGTVRLGDQDPFAILAADREDIGGVEAVAADDYSLVPQLAQLLDQIAAVSRKTGDDNQIDVGPEDGGRLSGKIGVRGHELLQSDHLQLVAF